MTSILFQEIDSVVRNALQEDIGSGDLTAKLIPQNKFGKAKILCRESAILCGSRWLETVFQQLDSDVQVTWNAKDGDVLIKNQVFCEISGNARAILSGERTALNFLQTLSATATTTRAYVNAVKGLNSVIVDTRKTIPGLRYAQKYAVEVGGGKNHRFGLYDGILIKENHIVSAGGIAPALQAARSSASPETMIMIEVENILDLEIAINNGAKLILLDNFTVNQLRDAVALNNKRAILEASGGVNLHSVRAIAETGVDRISVGSLTKDVKAIDLSMRFTL